MTKIASFLLFLCVSTQGVDVFFGKSRKFGLPKIAVFCYFIWSLDMALRNDCRLQDMCVKKKNKKLERFGLQQPTVKCNKI